MDVFRGQMTDMVLRYLAENLMHHKKVPANTNRYFQPLDLTAYREAKKFLQTKFLLWYSQQVIQGLQKGIPIEQVKVELKLSILKPLNAKWIMELYNYLTGGEMRETILDGCRRAGILDAVENGDKQLPPLDPFHDIDPMLEIPIVLEPEELSEGMFCSKYANMEIQGNLSDSDSEQEDEEGNLVKVHVLDDEDNEEENQYVVGILFWKMIILP